LGSLFATGFIAFRRINATKPNFGSRYPKGVAIDDFGRACDLRIGAGVERKQRQYRQYEPQLE
jgi:hypothetical protein